MILSRKNRVNTVKISLLQQDKTNSNGILNSFVTPADVCRAAGARPLNRFIVKCNQKGSKL